MRNTWETKFVEIGNLSTSFIDFSSRRYSLGRGLVLPQNLYIQVLRCRYVRRFQTSFYVTNLVPKFPFQTLVLPLFHLLPASLVIYFIGFICFISMYFLLYTTLTSHASLTFIFICFSTLRYMLHLLRTSIVSYSIHFVLQLFPTSYTFRSMFGGNRKCSSLVLQNFTF